MNCFATRESFEGLFGDAGVGNGFERFLYVNDPSQLPWHFLNLEIVYFTLGCFTLWHAFERQRLGIWVGIFVWGIVMESVGYFIQSHLHGQFTVQVFPFLPLKEVIWYPMILYTSFDTAKRMNFSSVWGGIAMMGLLSILTDIGYEMSNGRKNVHVVYVNPDCQSGALQVSNRVLDASMQICFSWTVLCGFMFGIIQWTEERKLGFFGQVLVISQAMAIEYPLFFAVNLLQNLTCSDGTIRSCARDSFVRPAALFAFTCAFFLLIIFNELQPPPVSPTTKVGFNPIALVSLGSSACFLSFLYIADEPLQERIDVALAVTVASLLTIGIHCLATKYPDRALIKRKTL